MEEYLQYMKTLRSQMTDVEDHAAKVSVEEQMQITTITTLEKDLDHALSEMKRLKEETDQKTRTKGEICSRILGKQRKISSMESDSANIAQSLFYKNETAYLPNLYRNGNSKEHLARTGLWFRKHLKTVSFIVSKCSSIYVNTAEEARTKLEEQKGWFIFHMSKRTGQQEQEKETRNDLMELSDSARAKLDQAKQMRSNLIQDNSKIMQFVEHVKQKINEFKPDLMSVDIKVLEEEYTALLSDESGEAEYRSSLQSQADKLKGISYIAKCDCGEEYSVGLA